MVPKKLSFTLIGIPDNWIQYLIDIVNSFVNEMHGEVITTLEDETYELPDEIRFVG